MRSGAEPTPQISSSAAAACNYYSYRSLEALMMSRITSNYPQLPIMDTTDSTASHFNYAEGN